MWKLISGMCLALGASAMADDTPSGPFVSVECCGRLRHGVAAIGGETTGTTITFNRTTWELHLRDEAARVFAKEHHKDRVVVTGTLRKVAGVERKVRWIIDVKTIAECDGTKNREGTRLSVHGTLQAADSRRDESSRMTVVTGRHAWPLDLSSDATLQSNAVVLVGQWVLLTGQLEQVIEKESDAPFVFVRVKTLKQSDSAPLRRPSD